MPEALGQAFRWLFSAAAEAPRPGDHTSNAYINHPGNDVHQHLDGTTGVGFWAGVFGAGSADGRGTAAREQTMDGSPWGFVSSRYTVTLIVMAILMNRIQHLCRPRRRTTLSKRVRLALRLPSLLFLAASLWPLSLLLLATLSPRLAALVPPPTYPWTTESLLRPASTYARDKSLMWQVFLSACTAVVSSTLVTSLQGGATTPPGTNASRGESPAFNLVGFAILLHFHLHSDVYPPSGVHVLACVLLQAAELLVLECTAAVVSPPIPRLPITTFFGVVSTVHYLLATSSGNYPFLQAFNRAPDVVLICIILLTVVLHALTMIVTEGKIDPSRLVFTRSNLPSVHEDYSLALFKLGTACLESTHLSGLSRELGALPTPASTWLEMESDGSVRVATRAEALGLPPPPEGSVVASKGWNREIRHVRVARENDAGGAFVNGGPRWNAIKRFLLTLAACVGTLARLSVALALDVLPFGTPRLPRWIRGVPRRVRLLWHGRRGEEARRTRLSAQAQRAAEKEELEVVRTLLSSPAVGEKLALHAQTMRGVLAEFDRISAEIEAARPASSSAGATGTSRTLTELKNMRAYIEGLSGIAATTTRARRGSNAQRASSALERMRRTLGIVAEPVQESEDEEDGEWVEADEDEELEEEEESGSEAETEQGFGTLSEMREAALSRRAGAAARRAMSRGTTPLEGAGTDAESDYRVSRANSVEPDESAALLQLARIDFDQAQSTSVEQPFNHVLMAHLTSPTRGALTRRGYAQLVAGRPSAVSTSTAAAAAAYNEASHLSNVIAARRTEAAPRTADELARSCVICLCEERTIICWPCRCLALCDGCRESLASRPPRGSAAGTSAVAGGSPTHTCPTCRSPVQAFSRVFYP